MKTFKDNLDREWSIDFTTNTISRVRSLTGFDPMGLAGGDFLEKIGDPVNLANVLYAICKPQVDERKLTDEDFGRGLRGNAIADAQNTLLEDLIDFFPNARRQTLRSLLAKGREIEMAGQKMVDQKIAAVDVDKVLAQLLATSGNFSGVLPELSASTPVN